MNNFQKICYETLMIFYITIQVPYTNQLICHTLKVKIFFDSFKYFLASTPNQSNLAQQLLISVC